MRLRWWCALMAVTGASAWAQQPVVTAKDSVTVTADRGLVGVSDAAASVAVVGQAQMEAAPGLALDDKMHQVAGFQLFRRTSSWTANPTSQGVSLRGLGSTAASRTLVVEDEVPLNDAYGGWVHWDEVPALALKRVELLRGGAADLYGSSAIGGVVDMVPRKAGEEAVRVAADVSGATENSALGDSVVSVKRGKAAGLGALSVLSTGGYVPATPAIRGAADSFANVTSEAARVELREDVAKGAGIFLRGNVLNETRQNGTVVQTNGTRLWRYVGGADARGGHSAGAVRAFGSRQTYRQTFSSLSADRNTEKLTRLQRVPDDEFGGVVQGTYAVAKTVTVAAGLDVRDVRATDAETPVTNGAPGAMVSVSARQRDVGGFVDGIWQPGRWSLSGSVRVDSFRTFDGQQVTQGVTAVKAEPVVAELVASPRVGVVRAVGHGVALTGTAFRAFRGPTMNELYRTGQVGQQTTLANASLLAERATGFELGGEVLRAVGSVRATYFWTEVNRPVSAVLLSQTATTQTLQRQNLGQIRSRGLMVEMQAARWRGVDASFGYQLAVATVTKFNAASAVQTNLLGKWIPQVPRQAVTVTLGHEVRRVASFHAIGSYTGEQFDDAQNQFVLHPYARMDVSAERVVRGRLRVFAGAQNVFDRTIDAARTPALSLAAPRLVQGGLRYEFVR